MLFTEPSFLFLFLPILLLVYYLSPARAKNPVLTVASLLFYALGEWKFLPWMILSICLNYVLAIWIENTRSKAVLALGISSDLALLLVFKYTGWLVTNLNLVTGLAGWHSLPVPQILLPLGISFFTFHKISYKVDVYRGDTPAQRDALTLSLYILFFPQLIAGPIVRYHDISEQLRKRSHSLEMFAEGVRRMLVGMAKKMIIANTAALIADQIFALGPADLSPSVAWLGILGYTLQIYFDFSGYSDMAIGLALMFGFRFLENFNHPYSALSITDFWRRWHISLSRWFRDYLYIPLGGNQLGSLRTYRNLLTVFVLCGLWHGASWNFLAWGLYHGMFLVIERLGLARWLSHSPRLLQRAYTLFVVMVGWCLFRASSMSEARVYLKSMLGLRSAPLSTVDCSLFLDYPSALILLIGMVLSFPIRPPGGETPWRQALATITYLALFLVCCSLIAAGTYSPFLYFRF